MSRDRTAPNRGRTADGHRGVPEPLAAPTRVGIEAPSDRPVGRLDFPGLLLDLRARPLFDRSRSRCGTWRDGQAREGEAADGDERRDRCADADCPPESAGDVMWFGADEDRAECGDAKGVAGLLQGDHHSAANPGAVGRDVCEQEPVEGYGDERVAEADRCHARDEGEEVYVRPGRCHDDDQGGQAESCAASSRSSGNTPCPGSNHCISRTLAMSGRTPRVMLPFAAAVTAAHADPVSHALPTDHHHSRCVRLRSRAPAGAQSAGCAGERSVPSRLRRPSGCASPRGSRRASSRPPPGRRWCRSPTTCCAGPRR